MRSPVATAVAIAVGLVTLLLAYILPSLVANIPGAAESANNVRSLILGWAVSLVAIASIVAILSLVAVHFRKLRARRGSDPYSLFTLIFFFVTLFAGGAAYILNLYQSEYQQVFVNSIQTPVESSLMAVLAITLALAGFRLFQRRRGIIAVSFLISVLVFLLFNSGIISLVGPLLPADWIGALLGVLQVLPVAGGRGILIGIALGSIMAGLRILFGAERPYSG